MKVSAIIVIASTFAPIAVGQSHQAATPLSTVDFASRFRSYVNSIKAEVAKNWYLAEIPSSTPPGATVYIQFDVARDGSVSAAHIITSSGFNVLDSSCLRAVQRIDGFSPLPAGYANNNLTVAFHCSYPGSHPTAGMTLIFSDDTVKIYTPALAHNQILQYQHCQFYSAMIYIFNAVTGQQTFEFEADVDVAKRQAALQEYWQSTGPFTANRSTVTFSDTGKDRTSQTIVAINRLLAAQPSIVVGKGPFDGYDMSTDGQQIGLWIHEKPFINCK